MQVEAVTAMIVHMLKLKEIAGHLQVEPSLNVQLIGFLSFLRWILLLILPTRPTPPNVNVNKVKRGRWTTFAGSPFRTVPHMSSSSSKILEDAGSRCVKCPPLSDFQRIKRPDVIEADSERVGPINVGKLRTSEPQGP